MKFLKMFIVVVLSVFAFSSADAQINVRIGQPRHQRRVVVVHRHHRPMHHRHFHH